MNCLFMSQDRWSQVHARPEGPQGCSHGWSGRRYCAAPAQPVGEEISNGTCPGGAEGAHAPIDGRRTPLSRRAFTLIELLIASVLAAVLIGGIVLAAGALARDARESGSVDPASQFDAAANLIRRDLANAQSAQFRPDGSVVLVGHGGLEPATGRPTGRLVRIEYRLVNPGRRESRFGEAQAQLLLRDQSPLDVPGEGARWRELVLAGVTGLQLSPASDDAMRSSTRDARAMAARQVSVPGRVRLRAETTGGASDRIIDVR